MGYAEGSELDISTVGLFIVKLHYVIEHGRAADDHS